MSIESQRKEGGRALTRATQNEQITPLVVVPEDERHLLRTSTVRVMVKPAVLIARITSTTAQAQNCRSSEDIPPPPPKAIIVNCAGSFPTSTVTARIARIRLLIATR